MRRPSLRLLGAILGLLAVAPPAARAAADWKSGIPEAHPRIYLNARNKARLKKMLAAGLPEAKRFRGMVDSVVEGGRSVYGFSAADAALMYQLTGEAKYAAKAIAMIDAGVTAENRLIAAGKRAKVSADSYLHVGGRIGALARTYDWCHDRLTDGQKKAWADYANQAVWNVWHHTEASWGAKAHRWSGWSVNNPGNNYYYSFLTATMMLGLATRGENPKAEGWLEFFREEKLEKQLIPYFNSRLAGGGSREGTGYGASHRGVFHVLDAWQASTGEEITKRLAHPRESILYMIHSTVPTLDAIAPIGDHARDSSARLFDYHRDYVLAARAIIADDRVREIAQGWLAACGVPRMRHGFMARDDFLGADPSIRTRPLTELALDYYGSGTGHIFMRSSWRKDAAWASFICGPFDESHAHEDQGSFVIARQGWLATDENIYTHSGIHQETRVHNLVRFHAGGKPVRQVRSREPAAKLLALQCAPEYVYAAADLSGVHVSTRTQKVPRIGWTRQLLFVRPGVFIVFDRVPFEETGVKSIWTLNLPAEPEVEGNTVTVSNGKAKLTSVTLLPEGSTPKKLDWQSLNKDPRRKAYRGGWRVDVAGEGMFLHVLHVDGAVTKVEGGPVRRGAEAVITLADGRKVTAGFQGSGMVAGGLKIEKAGRALVETGLGLKVTAPPVYAEGEGR